MYHRQILSKRLGLIVLVGEADHTMHAPRARSRPVVCVRFSWALPTWSVTCKRLTKCLRCNEIQCTFGCLEEDSNFIDEMVFCFCGQSLNCSMFCKQLQAAQYLRPEGIEVELHLLCGWSSIYFNFTDHFDKTSRILCIGFPLLFLSLI